MALYVSIIYGSFVCVKSGAPGVADDRNEYSPLFILNDSCYVDTVTDQELETVVLHVKDRLPELLAQSPATIPNDYFRLTERIVRVEEAIRNLGLIMEKRFEAVDKRFEDLIHQMDKRFEAVDRRFESVDKRFEDMNKRFEDMNKRFDAIGRRFNWTIGITTALITGLGVLITIYRFLGPVSAG